MGNQGNDEDAGGGQATGLENVVRIPRDWFGPPEDLVPFGPQVSDQEPGGREPPSPSRVEAGAPVDPNSFWDEASSSIQHVVDAARDGDTQEIVGATSTGQPSTAGTAASWGRRSAELRHWLLRPRVVAGVVAATVLAFASAAALGLVGAHRASKKPSAPGHAGQSDEYASVPNTDSIDSRMVERPHFRRSVSVSHPKRSTRTTHRSVSPHVSSNFAKGEPVSYEEAPPVNHVATSSGESASGASESYHPPPAAPNPAQRSSATTASASDRSNSSASQAPHPSPTGVLTCLTNCG